MIPERLTAERWMRVKELFIQALEREPEGRIAFLEEACAGDSELSKHVQNLLAFDARADSFLEHPAIAPPAEADMEWMLGSRIGPYLIVREIGRGGMGTVFLADRADEQFRRQVAIKLVKRGMDTDAMLHRFRRERQILAQ